jgi:heme-degrading monooxygenase HmoA
MYARAVNVQFQSGKADEANHLVKNAIVPVLQEQKGFKGQLFLTQRDTGKAISINLWETEDDLTAFESSPVYSAQREELVCGYGEIPNQHLRRTT